MGVATLANNGDLKTEKFEAMALEYMDLLYRSALVMSGNESDAQDLVQDTYLRAYRFFDKFEEGTDCRAWLLTIMRNTFINTIRHDSRKPQMTRISDMEERGFQLSSSRDTEDEVFANLFGDDVAAAVNALPGKYKDVVLLADVEGLSYKEIADISGCPIGTVMSRLHRGRRLLRRKLGSYATRIEKGGGLS